ncbi:hypothetical protein C8F01DRAFT_1083586 [Mycena amicta]|nr:hypothetical protein C8F01DRAFT_1083586 [Mycena amicta]
MTLVLGRWTSFSDPYDEVVRRPSPSRQSAQAAASHLSRYPLDAGVLQHAISKCESPLSLVLPRLPQSSRVPFVLVSPRRPSYCSRRFESSPSLAIGGIDPSKDEAPTRETKIHGEDLIMVATAGGKVLGGEEDQRGREGRNDVKWAYVKQNGRRIRTLASRATIQEAGYISWNVGGRPAGDWTLCTSEYTPWEKSLRRRSSGRWARMAKKNLGVKRNLLRRETLEGSWAYLDSGPSLEAIGQVLKWYQR